MMHENPEYILVIQGPVVSIGTNYTMRKIGNSSIEINTKDYILSNIDNFKKYYKKVIFSSYKDTPKQLISELKQRGVYIFLNNEELTSKKFIFIETHRLNSKLLQIKGMLRPLIEFQKFYNINDYIIRIRTDILINFDILFEDLKNTNNSKKEVILTHLNRYNKFKLTYSDIPDFVYIVKSNVLINILVDLNSNEYHEQIHQDLAHSISRYYQIFSIPTLKVQKAIVKFLPKKIFHHITYILNSVNNILFSLYHRKKIGLLSENFSRQMLWRESSLSEEELKNRIFLSRRYTES